MNDDIHALSGAYAVDAVDDAERAEFERHLAACAECQAEVESFRNTALELSVLIRATPPERLREQVLRDISAVRPLPPEISREAGERIAAAGRRPIEADQPSRPDGGAVSEFATRSQRRTAARRGGNRWLAAAAAVVVLGGGTVAVLHPWDRQSQSQVTLADRVLQAPDAQRFEKPVAGGGTATVVRSASVGKAVLLTQNISAAPSGKVYQLWLQAAGDKFVSAGLLPAGPDQTVVLDGDAAGAKGAGISVEPAGGSAQPTLPAVALIPFA